MFHPVGQGLFSSGELIFKNSSTAKFNWVYDCGTTSSQKLMKRAIDNFSRYKDKLDLVIISHFDHDHISGIVQLLNDIGTHDLMLPWAPLWQRLLIAFSQNLDATDPEILFFIDPAQYLINEAGDGFERIVFVPISDGDGPPETFDGEPSPEPDGSEDTEFSIERKPKLDIPISRLEDSAKSDDETSLEWHEYSTNVDNASKVIMMQEGAAATLLGLWEFIPYNDPDTKPKNYKTFSEEVKNLKRELLDSTEQDRVRALKALKKFYLRVFPSAQLNDISLFLYSGPIGSWQTCHFYAHHWETFNIFGFLEHCKGSILYTGDGSLKVLKKWLTLEKFLGQKRSYNPTVFQVPHHGSEKNWWEGLGEIIEPKISIFSSDPKHKGYKHPNGEVVRDLLPYQPVQVDKSNGFYVSFCLCK